MRGGRPSSRKRKASTGAGKSMWRVKFIKALCDIPNVTHACERAGIIRETAYDNRKKDPEFAAAWEAALQHGIDSLEAAAMERAKHGLKKGVWMKDENGKIVKVETLIDYPEALTQFLLKAHKPEKYREPKGQVDLSATTTTNGAGETKTEFSVHVSAEELP